MFLNYQNLRISSACFHFIIFYLGVQEVPLSLWLLRQQPPVDLVTTLSRWAFPVSSVEWLNLKELPALVLSECPLQSSSCY